MEYDEKKITIHTRTGILIYHSTEHDPEKNGDPYFVL